MYGCEIAAVLRRRTGVQNADSQRTTTHLGGEDELRDVAKLREEDLARECGDDNDNVARIAADGPQRLNELLCGLAVGDAKEVVLRIEVAVLLLNKGTTVVKEE